MIERMVEGMRNWKLPMAAVVLAMLSAHVCAQQPSSFATGSSTPSLMSMITNLGAASTAVVEAIEWAMYAIGTYFVSTGVTDSMKASGNSGHHNGASASRAMWRIAFGGLLLGGGYTLQLMKVASITWESYGDLYGVYGSGRAAGTDPFSQFLLAITRIIQVYGAYAIFKGVLLWKQAADGQDQAGFDKAGSGFSHVFFGGLCADCINIYTQVAMFFGFTIPAFFPK